MAINHFHNNRKQVQKALYSSGFIKVIEDTEYIVEEHQLKVGSNKLREVKFLNLPKNAWALDLELKAQSPFSIAGKVPEKAIAFYTEDALYIIMVELKAQLNYKKTKESQEKFQNGIRKIATLLPIHIYDNDFDNIEHRYLGIIAYNESSHLEGTLRSDNTKASKTPIFTAFTASNNRATINLDDDNLGRYKVDVSFCQNTDIINSPEYMEIDLVQFFSADASFLTLITNNKNCPKV
jgi:hypothetical protein